MAYEEVVKGTTINDGAASRFINKIQLGQDDLSLLCIGDSVSDSVGEWLYMLAQWLGTTYPTHTVSYRNWNSGTEAYNSATTLSTGTGSRTIRVWNVAVGSMDSYYVMASRFQTAVVDTAADVAFIAEGHNHVEGYDMGLGMLLALTQQLTDALPDVQVILSTINPRTDGANDRAINASDIAKRLCLRYGYILVDVYRAMLDNPNWATEYIDPDGVHPISAGHQVWLGVAKRPFEPRRQSTAVAQTGSTFQSTDENLLRNSRFTKWTAGTSAAPDFWTLYGTAAVVAQGTVSELSPTPMKLSHPSGAANGAYVYQNLDAKDQPKVKGRWVTLSARVYIPASVTFTTDVRAFLTHTGGTIYPGMSGFLGTASTPPGPVKGAYQWIVATCFLPSTIPSDLAAQIRVQAGAAGAGEVTVDRMSLVVGGNPREWSESILDTTLPDVVSGDRGNNSVTLTASDAPIQRFLTTLTANRTVTLPTTNLSAGRRFRIIRGAGGAFTLTVQTIASPGNKVFAATPVQGWVEVLWDGTQWLQTGTGPWP